MAPSNNIADYDLGDILGVGTVGTVYACREKSTGHSYALKKLHLAASRDPLIRARFKREISVMQRLDHPNIVTCYGGGESTDGTLYYLMELVDGGTVKGLLQMQPRMPWPAVVYIGSQLCSALQCAHNNGVVHRDLKPSNLFLNRDADLRLGDFGIARDLHNTDLSASGMTVGTHGYMAPEQITGDDMVSGKADLYSLGCCLFEMLTGQAPFSGENAPLLFEQHLRATAPRVKSLAADCPDSLDTIVNELLAKKPDDRPFNARQVQGVMISLGEQVSERGDWGLPPRDAHSDSGDDSNNADQAATGEMRGADSVAALGHEILLSQIAKQRQGVVAKDIGWGRIAVIAVVILLAIVAAFFSQK